MRASLSPHALQAVGRLARGAAPVLSGAAATPVQRRLLGGAAGLVGRALTADRTARLPALDPRHPMLPSAIRVERSRIRRGEDRGDQTAVTMWFGSGPALPGAGGGSQSVLRAVLRIGAGVVAAGAVAAASAYASRIEAGPSRVIEAATPERRPPG